MVTYLPRKNHPAVTLNLQHSLTCEGKLFLLALNLLPGFMPGFFIRNFCLLLNF